MIKIMKKIGRYFGDWYLAVLNPGKGRWIVAPGKDIISYLKAMNARGNHILMKPKDENEGSFLLLDDLKQKDLVKDHQHGERWKHGRMIVETSPDNFQVWIRAHRTLTNTEKAYWIKRCRADTACSPKHRWGRCPGFRNRKPKYENIGYPLANLIWVDWSSTAMIPQMHNRDATETFSPSSFSLCVKPYTSMICRNDYDKNNESSTDFAYALALLRRGHSPETVKQKILAERKDWSNHAGETRLRHYLDTTVKKANCVITG